MNDYRLVCRLTISSQIELKQFNKYVLSASCGQGIVLNNTVASLI